MPEHNLYESFRVEGSYFNAMLNCHPHHNRWLEIALRYLPPEVFARHKDGLLFTSVAHRDACRLARHHCETREIILLSERVLPGGAVQDETHPKARYFIFVVLHEVAHVDRRHKSPKFDHLSGDDQQAQEREANDQALQWFNEHVMNRDNLHLKPITTSEIDVARAENRRLMEQALAGV